MQDVVTNFRKMQFVRLNKKFWLAIRKWFDCHKKLSRLQNIKIKYSYYECSDYVKQSGN